MVLSKLIAYISFWLMLILIPTDLIIYFVDHMSAFWVLTHLLFYSVVASAMWLIYKYFNAKISEIVIGITIMTASIFIFLMAPHYILFLAMAMPMGMIFLIKANKWQKKISVYIFYFCLCLAVSILASFLQGGYYLRIVKNMIVYVTGAIIMGCLLDDKIRKIMGVSDETKKT